MLILKLVTSFSIKSTVFWVVTPCSARKKGLLFVSALLLGGLLFDPENGSDMSPETFDSPKLYGVTTQKTVLFIVTA
jgi:hypothetical protein